MTIHANQLFYGDNLDVLRRHIDDVTLAPPTEAALYPPSSTG